MTDQVDESGGTPSRHKVAWDMAENILYVMEDKSSNEVSRVEFLTTVADCVQALKGIRP